MRKEYDLDKLKVKKKGNVVSRDSTISKTIRINIDVLDFLLKESEKKGIGYQTLISMILKDAMNSQQKVRKFSKEEKSEIRKIVIEEMKKAA